MQQNCIYGCENTIGSYHCLDSKEVEIFATEGNAGQTTEMNAPVKACGDGTLLDESGNCVDIDECKETDTGCEHCQNTIGSYHCTCPDGFELNSDQKTCKYEMPLIII